MRTNSRLLLIIFGVLAITESNVHSTYVQYDVAQQKPIDLMVDTVNSYGLRVLYEHNFLNENNVAFSPYGLAGILIALYEGVDGDSSFEIRRSLQLPWDKGLMRIGFRDVHRLMKSYFIPEEGFLAGLTFNRQNIKLNRNYKNILNFYGFDFEMLEMSLPTTTTNPTTMTIGLPTPNNITTTASAAVVTAQTTQTTLTNPQQPVTISQTPSTMTIQMSTTMIVQNKDGDTNVTTLPPLTLAQTDKSTFAATSTATVTSEHEMTTINEIITTIPNNIANVTNRQETTIEPTNNIPMDTTISSTLPFLSSTVTVENTVTTPVTVSPDTQFTAESTTLSVTSTTMSSPDNQFTAESTTLSVTSTTMSSSDTTLSNETTMDDTSVTQASGTITSSDTLFDTRASSRLESPDKVGNIVVNSITEESNADITVQENFSIDNLEYNLSNPKADFEIFRLNDTMTELLPLVSVIKRNVKISAPDILAPARFDRLYFYNLYNPNLESNGLHHEGKFLSSDNRNAKVDYMMYRSYLDFAYLPYLRCLVLKLPLDNDKYYMMIFLPEHEHGLDSLVKDLAEDATNLKKVHDSLEKTYVNAWVPSFTVKGIISLTADLQREFAEFSKLVSATSAL